jgi:hypothetical protein
MDSSKRTCNRLLCSHVYYRIYLMGSFQLYYIVLCTKDHTLCIAYFFVAVSLSNARILIFLDSKIILFIDIAELIFVIVSGFILTYFFGILGMSFSILAWVIFKAVIMYLVCKKSYLLNLLALCSINLSLGFNDTPNVIV